MIASAEDGMTAEILSFPETPRVNPATHVVLTREEYHELVALIVGSFNCLEPLLRNERVLRNAYSVSVAERLEKATKARGRE